MSAIKGGIPGARILSAIARSITTVAGELMEDIRALAAHYRSRRRQRRMLLELHRINDHALRDIGLVRDRFSGVILDGNKGDIVLTLPQSPEEATLPESWTGERDVRTSGYRGRERRSSDRRLFQRRADGRISQEPQRPDRRAYDRRSPICQVLDCRELFSGRSRFLLT